MSKSTNKFALIIPTLGNRDDFLQQNIESVSRFNEIDIYVVAPDEVITKLKNIYPQVYAWVSDPGTGLAAAINQAETKLESNIAFMTWLGDDDVLVDFDAQELAELMGTKNRVATFGIVEYIDIDGEVKFRTGFGKQAVRILKFGPNKIPQPGSWFSRKAFNQLGKLDETLGWAFDYDMFIKLASIGSIEYLPKLVAKFRWHPGSLSAGQSQRSIYEASLVRTRSLHPALRIIAPLWEKPHVWLAKFMVDKA